MDVLKTAGRPSYRAGGQLMARHRPHRRQRPVTPPAPPPSPAATAITQAMAPARARLVEDGNGDAPVLGIEGALAARRAAAGQAATARTATATTAEAA